MICGGIRFVWGDGYRTAPTKALFVERGAWSRRDSVCKSRMSLVSQERRRSSFGSIQSVSVSVSVIMCVSMSLSRSVFLSFSVASRVSSFEFSLRVESWVLSVVFAFVSWFLLGNGRLIRLPTPYLLLGKIQRE